MSDTYNDNQERLDYRAGLICAVLANINRSKKSSKTFSPLDFMPTRSGRNKKPPSLEQMLAVHIASGGDDPFKEEKVPERSQEELKQIVENLKRTGKPDG